MDTKEFNMVEEDRASEEYWDWRVRTHKNNLNQMVWYSGKIHEQLEWVKPILSPFSKMTVLDVGCGWGRVAHLFEKDKYLGFDFSQEMINVAKEENPGYSFEKQDGRTYTPKKKFDIILMYHMTDAMQLVERYKPFANYAVVVIGASDVYIYSPESFS